MSEETEPRDQSDAGVQWEIVGFSLDHPFSGQLVFSDGPDYQVAAELDPLFVNELRQALAAVHEAQLSALGVRPAPEGGARPATAETANTVAADVPADVEKAADTRPWWRRHLILAVLFGIVGVAMLYSFVTGSMSVQN